MRRRTRTTADADAPRRRSGIAAVAAALPLAVSMIPTAVQPSARGSSVAHVQCGIHCGTERWPIKTLSDAGATEVTFTPVPTTVSSLVSILAPDQGGDERLNNIEKQTFTVRAKLVGYKLEFKSGKGDRDFHIVLQDLNTDETMIVEIPDSECDGVCNSVARDRIVHAREQFLAAFPDNPPGSQFVVLDDPFPVVEVTGVGLFDFFHGQTGVARNCLELHPVLDIQFPPPGTFKAKNDPARQPRPDDESEHQCISE